MSGYLPLSAFPNPDLLRRLLSFYILSSVRHYTLKYTFGLDTSRPLCGTYMNEIKPTKVQSMSCDSLVVQAQIVHGGQWVVMLYGDGTLHLREIGCDIASVVDGTFKAIVDDVGGNDGINMSLSLSDCHETLLSLTIFCSRDVL